MKHITPEAAGLSSNNIKAFVESLEKAGLSTHSVVIAKGDDIFFEQYWAPYHKDYLHRWYSVTKSIVSIAIGFCEQEGLLDLDDKIVKYFPEESRDLTDENMLAMTVRDMLKMTTAREERMWLKKDSEDPVKLFFANCNAASKPAGTMYKYDSTGSIVLTALVKRVTGLEFMDYLRGRLFDKIGVRKDAYCLTCKGGHSWGSSALMATPLDMIKIARFTMNKGKWNGEQLLNEAYLTAATSKQVDNCMNGFNDYNTWGYGYQIWRTYDNSFSFNGMGCQYAICVPDKELVFTINSDNQLQGAAAKKYIFDEFFRWIARPMAEQAIAEDAEALAELKAYCSTLKLAVAEGLPYVKMQDKINGVKYQMSQNPMGIEHIQLDFEEEVCKFTYKNAQGDKCILFKMGENVFDKFPQEGYSGEVGGETTKNYYYDCAASGAWIEPDKLLIKVQIIDIYLGGLNIFISFKKDKCVVKMIKVAQNFLGEYEGIGVGTMA